MNEKEAMKSLLARASKAYYEGNPIMSDEAFDAIAEQVIEVEIGYVQEQADRTISHLYPMFSLQKYYSGESDPSNILPEPYLVTPKLDGAAISLIYMYGTLTLAITRGDGKEGKDISEHIKTLATVPKQIEGFPWRVQITGELVAPKEIENARNYAAGALGLKSVDQFKQRDLTFVAYDIQPNESPLWSIEMSRLKEQGFHTVLDADWNQFPQDGTVWRCDSYEVFSKLGYTSHHPRGAFAYKTRQPGVITTLTDVVWQVGKSGVVSPVAILEPININGATVSRATLHNMKYIEELGLELGCQVEVIRSGEIIPRVVRRV